MQFDGKYYTRYVLYISTKIEEKIIHSQEIKPLENHFGQSDGNPLANWPTDLKNLSDKGTAIVITIALLFLPFLSPFLPSFISLFGCRVPFSPAEIISGFVCLNFCKRVY